MKKLLARLDLSYIYAFVGEATLALTLAFFIVLARELGPEKYGIFAAAVALAAILSLFIQCGIPPLINREVAAHPEAGQRMTVKALLVEALSSCGVFLILLPLAWVLGYRGEGILICYLAVLAEVWRAMIMTLRNVAKGVGWFRAESVAVTVERATTIVISCWVLFQTQNLVLVMATTMLVRGLNTLGLFYYLNRRLNLWSEISWKGLREIVQKSYPFALAGVLWIIYYQVDVVMLGVLSSEAETGFYSASYRILEIFSALPRVIFYVIYTRFSKYHVKDPDKLPEQIYKGTRLLLGVVMPTVLVASFFQETLVEGLYGAEFSRSVASLSILLPSLSIKMIGGLANHLCQATEHEKKLPPLLLGAALTNVGINCLLIPRLGSPGAALATFMSECLLTVLTLILIRKIGYKQIGVRLGWLTIFSLVVTGTPSLLIFTPLPLGIGIALILGGCAAIFALMRPNQFMRLDSPQVTVN